MNSFLFLISYTNIYDIFHFRTELIMKKSKNDNNRSPVSSKSKSVLKIKSDSVKVTNIKQNGEIGSKSKPKSKIRLEKNNKSPTNGSVTKEKHAKGSDKTNKKSTIKIKTSPNSLISGRNQRSAKLTAAVLIQILSSAKS